MAKFKRQTSAKHAPDTPCTSQLRLVAKTLREHVGVLEMGISLLGIPVNADPPNGGVNGANDRANHVAKDINVDNLLTNKTPPPLEVTTNTVSAGVFKKVSISTLLTTGLVTGVLIWILNDFNDGRSGNATLMVPPSNPPLPHAPPPPPSPPPSPDDDRRLSADGAAPAAPPIRPPTRPHQGS